MKGFVYIDFMLFCVININGERKTRMSKNGEQIARSYAQKVLDFYNQDMCGFSFYLDDNFEICPRLELDLAKISIYCKGVLESVGQVTFRPSNGHVIDISSSSALMLAVELQYYSERGLS